MYSLLRQLLFLLPPEQAHTVALQGLKFAAPLISRPADHNAHTACTVMGIDFPNRVGLAAGLDKNGEYITALSQLGFGFIEVGTVTPKAQPGQAKPRLFRLPEQQALINRLGFNNKGIDALLDNVRALKTRPVLGINIGKNASTPIPAAVEDYLYGLEKAYRYADYITVNISSPNTPNLRQIQTPELLSSLLTQLKDKQAVLAEHTQRYVSIAVKISPDVSVPELEAMTKIFLRTKIDAVIATNTTVARHQVPQSSVSEQAGGLSGAPLFQASLEVVRVLKQQLGDQIPIIACGGIMSVADAQAKLAAGAQLVQLYTGFIYQGPGLIRQLAAITP